MRKRQAGTDRYRRARSLALSMKEKFLATAKTALQLLPFGIGSAIVEGYFGTIDERKLKRMNAFIEAVGEDLQKLGRRVVQLEKLDFTADEFAQLFEATLQRVLIETRKEKLKALRGALVSIILGGEGIGFDKKNSFIKTLDACETVHVQILQTLATLAEEIEEERFLTMHELCLRLNAEKEADVNFVYSALDTLANREFVQTGPIPWTEKGTIDKAKQMFRITALGLQFLVFLRQLP